MNHIIKKILTDLIQLIRLIIVPLVLFFLQPETISGQQTPLNAEQLTISWDPYRRSGEIYVPGGDIFSFAQNQNYMIKNFVTPIIIEPITVSVNGSINIPAATLNEINNQIEAERQNRNMVNSYAIQAIVIDAGHGGNDPGANHNYIIDGVDTLIKESDINLRAALFLADMLRRHYSDKQIILTRDSDKRVELKERTAIADNIETADNRGVIFISLHVNSTVSRTSTARGFEIWCYPPGGGSRAIVDENFTDQEISEDLRKILNDIWFNEMGSESVMLAQAIQAGLNDKLGDELDRGIRWSDALYVLRSPSVPSILIEMGFINNHEEVMRLLDDNYLKGLTNSIFLGIVEFIKQVEG